MLQQDAGRCALPPTLTLTNALTFTKVLIVLIGLVGYSGAQTTLYKYQDADGHWAFSDCKPTTNHLIETSPLNKKPSPNTEPCTAIASASHPLPQLNSPCVKSSNYAAPMWAQ
jgi:hypothetical protein